MRNLLAGFVRDGMCHTERRGVRAARWLETGDAPCDYRGQELPGP